MQENFETELMPQRRFPVREATGRASERLNGQHMTMVLSLLFVVTALYAFYLGASLLVELLLLLITDAPMILALYFAVISIMAVGFLLPLWAGRIRMAGLIAAGKPCELSDLFYYFRSLRLWRRGIGVMLLCVLGVLFPPCFSAAAIYAGKEASSLGGAISASFFMRIGMRNLLAFAGRVLWRLLLGVLTLGLLWIFYGAHHSAVTYFSLVMSEPSQTPQASV